MKEINDKLVEHYRKGELEIIFSGFCVKLLQMIISKVNVNKDIHISMNFLNGKLQNIDNDIPLP